MKKIMIIVVITAIAVATQAQVQRKIVPAPATFEITFNGNEIILSGSEVGVMYQLYTYEEEDKVAIGGSIDGTGNPIVFVHNSPEMVEIMAINKEAGCSVVMAYPVFDTIVAPNKVIWTTEQTDIETTPMVKTGDGEWKEFKKE